MRVLIDNSVTGASKLCESATGPQGPRFGPLNAHFEVWGLTRKKPNPSATFQAEADSLFTIGRLIREGQIEACTYSELVHERMWQPGYDPMVDALAECRLNRCPPAIERSRFQGGSFPDFFRKGGKKDRKYGITSKISQIAFMQMLCGLDGERLSKSERLIAALKLTEFDVESLKGLKTFQRLCKLGNSPENYPDIFHWWTAQRNHIDAFLTMDFTFSRIARQIAKSRGVKLEYPTEVLKPSELLAKLGISEPDPIPIPHGRFFTLTELWSDAPSQRFALFRVRNRK